jgi:hypothetical protein
MEPEGSLPHSQMPASKYVLLLEPTAGPGGRATGYTFLRINVLGNRFMQEHRKG